MGTMAVGKWMMTDNEQQLCMACYGYTLVTRLELIPPLNLKLLVVWWGWGYYQSGLISRLWGMVFGYDQTKLSNLTIKSRDIPLEQRMPINMRPFSAKNANLGNDYRIRQ